MSSIVRWQPFEDLVSLRDAMDRLFEESFIRPRTWLVPFEGGLAVDVANAALAPSAARSPCRPVWKGTRPRPSSSTASSS